MNTRSKRASSVGIALSFVLAPPLPDGTLVVGDRKHIAFSYAGTFAGEPIVPEPPPVIGPTGAIQHIFSDIEMNCPSDWYGGPKDARLERTGYGERMLSDMVTGEPTSSTFTFRVSDKDFLLRRALASTDRRYWVDPVTVHMTTRENRAVKGEAYLVYNGVIIDAQPARPLAWEITLGDIISQRIITDRAVHPSRKIGDGFIHDVATTALGTRVALSSALDYETPEAIIYGQHRRVRGVDPPSQHGFEVDLTEHYLGIWNVDGGNKHVWFGASHACKDIPDVNVVALDGTHSTVIPDEGLKWWIPHYAGWTSLFGVPYIDLHSTSFGNLRRYTLILGDVGQAQPDACAYASGGYAMDPAPEPLRLMAFIDGVEDVGDSTGDLIVEMAQCHKHWWKNYGARSAAESYQAGAWLDSPVWTLFGPDGTAVEVPMVDEASFDAVTAINQIRFPDLNGYPCAAIIGAKAGDIHPMSKWRADWNRSGFVVDGWTRKSQLMVATPHPTAAAKAAARLYTDALEIRQGSFETEVRWREQANRIPFRCDPDYPTGRYMTTGLVDAGDAITNYDREILGEMRDFPFAPGIAMGTHLAFLHAWLFKHPPRRITLEDTVGPDENGNSLGYAEIGAWIRYRHYAAVGEQGQERIAWTVRHQVQAGRRRVLDEAWDMEDLIPGSDVPPVLDEYGAGNDTCPTAIVITNGADEPYSITIDTTENATDPDVAGIVDLPGPAVGHHAAHFSYTPPSDGSLFLTTVHSEYDTQIAVCTGACGSLVLVEDGYNDNDGILTTSVLELEVAGGTTYHIVVYGYGPEDGGALTFGLLFTAGAPPSFGPSESITCS